MEENIYQYLEENESCGNFYKKIFIDFNNRKIPRHIIDSLYVNMISDNESLKKLILTTLIDNDNLEEVFKIHQNKPSSPTKLKLKFEGEE